MESKLIVAAAAAAGAALAGAAAGYACGLRRKGRVASALSDEESLAWLQRLSTVGRMMSGVVHEVRTPLNTVILTVEHAQRVLKRGGDPAEQLAAVSREAERAVTILSDILDFAKPTPLDLKPIELAPLLQGALEALKIRFDERGVETTLQAPPGLKVMASSRHLEQVLANLLINALDAMPFGGRLDIRASSAMGRAAIVLRDTGVGVEPETLKTLFEPFASTRLESGGTGLGLNVARWIMHKHGGEVAMASDGIGKGTTVILTLPTA